MEDYLMPMIKVEHLKYRYPHTKQLVLDDVSFEIKRGEFIGIIGENGAGKSTLSQALVGLVPQFYKGGYGGSVHIDGMEAATTPISQLCQKVGLVFQNPFNQLSGAKDTVYEEIGYGLHNLGVPREEMIQRIEEAMELLEIAQFKNQNPFDLSGGQMQRVALASILVMKPEILVLDEPTSQLDPKGSEEVYQAVDKLAKSGITIVMIEHKMEKIAEYCDRVMLLHKGKIVEFDTPQKVFAREDLRELGVKEPVYTQICKKVGLRNGDGTYPARLAELVEKKSRLLELLERNQLEKNEAKQSELEKNELEKNELVQEESNHHELDNYNSDENHPVKSSVDQNDSDENKSVNSSVIQNDSQQNESVKNTLASSSNARITSEKELKRKAVPQFQIQELSFSYEESKSIIKGLTLEIDDRTTAIIGQNGAGKTTMVKLLKGLLKPISGSISYCGEDISGKSVAMIAHKVGYVFQNPDDQIFKYNVLDEVMFGPLNIGMEKEKAKAKALKALATVGLSGIEAMNPYDLELSQRKMVAIASVLAMDTEVIILDEPTIAQDDSGRERIKQIIRELRANGKSVIAILHDMDLVAECFERVIVMAHGEILADGTPSEVFQQEEVLKEACLGLPSVASVCKVLGYGKLCVTVEELLS